MITAKARAVRAEPMANSAPKTVEYQCGSKDMTHKVDASVAVIMNITMAGAAQLVRFWDSAGSRVSSSFTDEVLSKYDQKSQTTKHRIDRPRNIGLLRIQAL